MKIVPNFDPERRLIIISFTSNLLNKYFSNFSGLIKKSSEFENLYVERSSSNTANIVFPLPLDSEFKSVDDGNDSDNSKKLTAISMSESNGKKMKKLYENIGKFVNTAMTKEFRNVEFLPLKGYSLENLKVDVKNAISNKRNFCVIEDYSEYLEMSKKQNFCFNQIYINYGTSEYSDVALSIMSGKIKELRESLIPKMKRLDWN